MLVSAAADLILELEVEAIRVEKDLKAANAKARVLLDPPEKERNETIDKEVDRVVITIEADRSTPWMFPVAVQDICEQAGFKRDRIVFGKPLGTQ